jgi:hypothetical protein
LKSLPKPSGIRLASYHSMEMRTMGQSFKKSRLALSALSIALFAGAMTLMLHDSVGVDSGLSQDDIQAVAASHPTLYDSSGKSVKLSDQEYERALISGTYRTQPGATVPIISPQGEVAIVDMPHAPTAFLQGWRVEPYEHALDRVIQVKQRDSMWISDGSSLFFHTILVQFSAVLLLGMYLLLKSDILSDRTSLISRRN